MILDGTTQPGYSTTPIIELNGTGAGNLVDGLVVTGAGSTIRGLVINRFLANGVVLDGSGALENHVEGSFIGTAINGIDDLGNGIMGILIQNGAHDNVIGGTAAGAGNLISRNGLFGIYLVNTGTTGNRMEGNFIGTDVTGMLDRGNISEGVRIEGGASSNTVGGTTEAARNIIAGNNGHGVRIGTICCSGIPVSINERRAGQLHWYRCDRHV